MPQFKAVRQVFLQYGLTYVLKRGGKIKIKTKNKCVKSCTKLVQQNARFYTYNIF